MNIKADLESILDPQWVLAQQPMAKYTSFNVGGPAELMVLPQDFKQVAQVIDYCKRREIDWYVLGRGSNVLVSDMGLQGVVVVIEENLAQVRVDGGTIIAQAGASLQRVSTKARTNSLTGLEFASGIPGTVGGAVVMNAGAYGGEMKDVVQRVTALSPQGESVAFTKSELDLGYRTSIFQHNQHVVLEVEMELAQGQRDLIDARMKDLARRRLDKQPLDKPSAGSTFKRPQGHYAGQLIEECGLRGHKSGGAAVSEKHCGFIVNDNKATAQEIYSLIRKVQHNVKQQHHVDLVPEVKIWGRFEDV